MNVTPFRLCAEDRLWSLGSLIYQAGAFSTPAKARQQVRPLLLRPLRDAVDLLSRGRFLSELVGADLATAAIIEDEFARHIVMLNPGIRI
jgi:hypothetical protein